MIWKKLIRDYFTFNRRERRGVFSLLIILCILSSIHLYLKFVPEDSAEYSESDIAEFQALAQSLIKVSDEENDVAFARNDSIHKKAPQANWRLFDPNKSSLDELIELGLPSSIAQRVIKYREKVKPFRSIEDLNNVYNIDTAWIRKAKPFVNFEDLQTNSRSTSIKSYEDDSLKLPKRQLEKIELNTADTNELKSIRGIGSFYAKQIVELRDRYNGFRSFEQLLDLYKVSDQTLTILAEKTTIDPTLAQQIDLNSCDVKQLGRHPFISWNQARIIIAYREQHGGFRSSKEIMRTGVISDSLYLKIAPYLECR